MTVKLKFKGLEIMYTQIKRTNGGEKKKKTHHEVLHFLTRGECVADCYACRHTPTVSAAVGMGVVSFAAMNIYHF